MQIGPLPVGSNNHNSFTRGAHSLNRTRQGRTPRHNDLLKASRDLFIAKKRLLERNAHIFRNAGHHWLGKNRNPRASGPLKHCALSSLSRNDNSRSRWIKNVLTEGITKKLRGIDRYCRAPVPFMGLAYTLGLEIFGNQRITEFTIDMNGARSTARRTCACRKRAAHAIRDTLQFFSRGREVPLPHDVRREKSLLRHSLRGPNSVQVHGAIRTDRQQRDTGVAGLNNRGIELGNCTSRGRDDAGARRASSLRSTRIKVQSQGKEGGGAFIKSDVNANRTVGLGFQARKSIGERSISRSGTVHEVANSACDQGVNDALR